MPNAEQLTAIAAIIAALTGLITAIGGFFNHRTTKAAKVNTDNIAAAVTTGNGSTLGENSDAIRDVIAPKSEAAPEAKSA
jgi:hypothetical protein